SHLGLQTDEKKGGVGVLPHILKRLTHKKEASRLKPEACRLKPIRKSLPPEACRLKPIRKSLKPIRKSLRPIRKSLKPQASSLITIFPRFQTWPSSWTIAERLTKANPTGIRDLEVASHS
ncbi:MAG: hypothetical protein FWD31_10635, partial [Planctomycetaceae bacterium]|nr:hypothetical protein [Planctomycetaceae bacterium]